ncbi:MAG: acetoacetate--CoA ligase [Gemmatimonadales bacterium]
MNTTPAGDIVLWKPTTARMKASRLGHFIDARQRAGWKLPAVTEPGAFDALHQWSIDHPEAFWAAVWHDAEVIADRQPSGAAWDDVLIGGDRMAPPDPVSGPAWFSGARLNFAENLLRHDSTAAAIIAWDERGPQSTTAFRQLRDDVAQCAAALRALGVGRGDRVAGWLPNIPEALVAMLATASIGAVWTSCSPDFGVDGIVDRFGQTEPVVLICADGYQYNGKTHDCLERLGALLPRLPTVRHTLVIEYLGGGVTRVHRTVQAWSAVLAKHAGAALQFERLPFDYPLYILYSSGTTGLPKCMVHGAGGTLLQHLKEHRLHVDLHPGERLFYFTTCGWMMWNWMASALAVGATLVIYDGAPAPAADPEMLWRMAARERIDVFGTSARFVASAEKMGHAPARHGMKAMRALLSTGSPLAPESFDWIHRAIGPHVQVSSISGGTDIVSCFVLGNPIVPVHRGEIQGAGLGMAVDILTDAGESCPVGMPGELVCRRPFPAMPVAFWNDPSGTAYRAAYFDVYPDIWRHGDWATRTEHGGYVIAGRSDATLNPGGVRIGTAEIYRQVEAIDEVVESLVIAQQRPGAAVGDVRIVLFVRLRDGVVLDDALEAAIRSRIRSGASPHHVPGVIAAVTDIPRTRSGKISEIAVRDVVEGREVRNVGALANPESLEQFRGRVELE